MTASPGKRAKRKRQWHRGPKLRQQLPESRQLNSQTPGQPVEAITGGSQFHEPTRSQISWQPSRDPTVNRQTPSRVKGNPAGEPGQNEEGITITALGALITWLISFTKDNSVGLWIHLTSDHWVFFAHRIFQIFIFARCKLFSEKLDIVNNKI